ncbi:MAG: glycosyltransferase [Oscillospiraceae bacterium]|nr:glycosyltransferase [Oscillospiraceae bacterium]
MINILFFIDTLSGGGAEKVLRTLVNNMDQERFQITVHTLEEADAERYLVPGIRYRSVNRCRTKLGRKLFSYWIRLCAELKWLYPLYIKDDYDIEVAYLECGSTKILAGSTNKKARKIAWVHCDLAKRDDLIAQSETLKQYYDSYDKVVCVSETAKHSFENVIGSNTEAVVLYNVNDEVQIREKAKAFIPERGNIPTFVAVGRLSYEKGIDRLLEACQMLKESGYNFQLWLIGEGPERQKLEQMIRDFALEQQVLLFGFQTNPYPFMDVSDFLVVPSRSEGLSTVVTEALILGKPVVTTPCSGMTELLGNSEYGLITEDSVEGIYAGIRKLLDDPALLARYARAAGDRGAYLGKQAVLAETERFLIEEYSNTI